jgi:hypothetical protein
MQNKMNTILVFGINNFILHLNKHHLPMSPELTEVSELIEEQFEIEEIDLDDEDFWQSLVNLFI